MFRTYQTVIAAVVVGALGHSSWVSAQVSSPEVEWHVSHDLRSSGETTTLALGNSAQSIKLMGGWSCRVSETSKHLPAYEARQVACENGNDVVEFSVQCQTSQPKSHTQLRFRNKNGQVADFIEIGCELAAK